MAESHTAVDIFGTLPLELSQRIPQYFQLYQIFQARRASKRWNTVLSSSCIVESIVLRPWYAEENSSLHVPEGLSESAVVSLKAEHIDAFRNGRAISVAVSNNVNWTNFLSYELIAYAKGILAWVITGERSIRLKCLESGKSETLASPDGATIEYIHLDGSLLVALTSLNICYVWRLFAGVQTIRILEPASFGSDFLADVVVSDSRLAILFYKERTDNIHLTTIDTTTRTTHDFELRVKRPRFESLDDFKILNTPGGKSVVYFERALSSPSYVYFTRVTPDGTVELQGHVKHPNIEGYTSHNDDTSVSLQLSGCVTLWSYLRHLPSALSDGPDTWLLLRICYVQDHLEVKEQTISHIGKTPPGLSTELFWWKDVVYMGNHLDEDGKLEVMDLSESTWKPTGMSLRRLPSNNSASLPSTRACRWLLLGDENFLISVRGGSCVVWCFNRHLARAITFEDDGM